MSNPSSPSFDATLVFQTPDRSSIRSIGGGCQKKSSEIVECIIKDIGSGESGNEFVQYDVPDVTKDTLIAGSVTLVGRQLSPVANYTTTVEAR